MIQLKNTLRITRIVKKTKALLFEELEIGDILILSLKIKSTWGQPEIEIFNPRLNLTASKTLAQLYPILNKFEFEELI